MYRFSFCTLKNVNCPKQHCYILSYTCHLHEEDDTPQYAAVAILFSLAFWFPKRTTDHCWLPLLLNVSRQAKAESIHGITEKSAKKWLLGFFLHTKAKWLDCTQCYIRGLQLEQHHIPYLSLAAPSCVSRLCSGGVPQCYGADFELDFGKFCASGSLLCKWNGDAGCNLLFAFENISLYY